MSQYIKNKCIREQVMKGITKVEVVDMCDLTVCVFLTCTSEDRTTCHQYSEWVRPVSIRRLMPTPSSHLHNATHVCSHARQQYTHGVFKSQRGDKWENYNMMNAVISLWAQPLFVCFTVQEFGNVDVLNSFSAIKKTQRWTPHIPGKQNLKFLEFFFKANSRIVPSSLLVKYLKGTGANMFCTHAKQKFCLLYSFLLS